MIGALMQRASNVLRLIALLAAASGCDMTAISSQDLNLPDGNAETGQDVFVSLGCMACHKVKGLDLPAAEVEGPVMVVLGGGVSKVKTYGELVTAIINPSHKLARRYPRDMISKEGESLMTSYNDVMTVTQLIDLVAFLQSQYNVVPRPGYRYPVYTYK